MKKETSEPVFKSNAVFVGGHYITTRYLGATNFKGARIAAEGNWHGKDGRNERRVYSYYESGDSQGAENHEFVARKLAHDLGGDWKAVENAKLEFIESPDGRGYIFFAPRENR
jgi:hypothetical protein